MSGETLDEFNKQVVDLKESLYDSIVRNNPKNNPGTTDSLRHYEELMRKIFTYWKTLYNSGAQNYTLRMPNHVLTDAFNEKTKWYINNILKNHDFTFRTNAMKNLERICITDAVNLRPY
jgi:hypothetical protein